MPTGWKAAGRLPGFIYPEQIMTSPNAAHDDMANMMSQTRELAPAGQRADSHDLEPFTGEILAQY